MSEFTDLYRARQNIRWRLKKTRRKSSPEAYWKLKDEEKAIGEKLDQIIKDDNNSRT